MTSKEWFKQAQFGMMIHWGLYALPAGEWKGQRTSHIGEWLQARYRIPIREYERLAPAFNPVLFDPEEWVKLAKGCGMQYIVVTAKHHDGFALYHSKVDPYNVVDATPFKRDVIAEIAAACQKHGLKLGLYYSQDLDWHEPDGGGYKTGYTNFGGLTGWTNDWDFPDASVKDYTRYFEKKVKPQLKEILTGYGPLCLIWFDTPRTISPQQSQELYNMVKFYQPGCLVNSRIGNGLGDYTSMGDNEIPDEDFLQALVESPTTLNDTWGYKSFDNNWKPAGQVRAIRKHLNDRGVNYLLNIGPDALGRIPAPAAAILRELAQP